MAITVDDLVWRSPENRTQFDDGGGRMTTTTVQPDTPGEIFPIISRQDGSYGRVHLAKVFAAVDTAGTETLYGAGAVLLEGPANTGVDVALLATGTASDRRTEARARVEAYLQKGPETRLTLFGTHYAGSRSMIAYQRPGQAVPAIGDRLFLYVASPSSEAVHKVESVEVETRVFEDDKGTFTMDVLTIGIFPALAIDYTGHSPSRYWISAKNTYILDPTIADAVRVYGLAKTTATLDASGNVVMVDDVMGRICPVATKETALSLRTPAGIILTPQSGPATLTDSLGSCDWTTRTIDIYLPTPIQPGSLRLKSGTPYNVYSAYDSGDGTIPTDANNWSHTPTIDYETGRVYGSYRIYRSTTMDFYISYTPAAFLPVSAFSKSQSITIATKGLVYLDTLTPLPGKRTVSVDYLALGQWYQLTDDGNGQLSGASSTYGTGTVDYLSGAITVTLGYPPDLDSEVIFRWGSDVGYQQIALGDISTPAREFATDNITPGDVTATWTSGGAQKSLAITGWTSGTGTAGVGGANGVLVAEPRKQRILLSIAQAALPDPQTNITLDYYIAPSSRITLSPTYPHSAQTTLDFAQAIIAGSFTANLSMRGRLNGTSNLTSESIEIGDDGAGLVITTDAYYSQTTIGTIDYATGAISIDLDGVLLESAARVVNDAGAVVSTKTLSEIIVGSISGIYASITGTPEAAQIIEGVSELTVNIDPQGGRITPNTFGLTLGSHTYYDRGGVLVRSIDSATNTGTDAGTIDYDTFAATLTSWTAGSGFAVKSGLTGPQSVEISGSKFRSAGAPLREGSCSFQATLANPYIAAHDEGTGKIVLDDQTQIGTVVYATGAVDITFGATVTRGSFIITWLTSGGVRQEAIANAAGEVLGILSTTGTLTAAGVLSMTIDSNVLPVTDSIRVTVARASNTLSEQADTEGAFTSGTVKQTTGIFNLSFSAPILADTLRYSAVQQTTVSLNAALIGLDPLRLPLTGTVPIFRDGDSVLIHHADTDTLPNPLSAGQVVNLSRTLLGDVEVRDAGGVLVPTAKYTADLDAGTLTFADPLDLSAYTQPLVCKHRIQERCTLSAVDLSGRLDLLVPPGRAFPSGSSVSSIVSWGDLMARAENVFDQVSWTGEWSNIRIGSDASGAYNTLTHPILLTNTAAVTERWRVTFTSSTAFSVYGETIGGVGSGTTSGNFSPTNSATGLPYFTIQAGGWGTGWATGNTLRFNTVGGQPLWITRSVQPGTTPGADAFRLGLLADIDPLEA